MGECQSSCCDPNPTTPGIVFQTPKSKTSNQKPNNPNKKTQDHHMKVNKKTRTLTLAIKQ